MSARTAIILIISGALLHGCVTIEPSPPTAFYLLGAPSTQPLPETGPGPGIGIGPLKLPEHLRRPQIVSRSGGHGALVADFHHWAGDLEQNMLDVLIQQLGARSGIRRVSRYPWPSHASPDYQIRLDILRFDGALGGEVVLSGGWSLLDSTGRRELGNERFILRKNARGADHQSYVATLNALLLRLGEQIGDAIGRRRARHGE